MAPKGLSMQEKQDRMLDLFHETRDYWKLPELEKMAPKMKGVISQSVKEVLENLVADHLVCSEKIGAATFYWSFPSAAGTTLTNQINSAQARVDALKASASETEAKLAEATATRANTEERANALAAVSTLQAQTTALLAEKDSYLATDSAEHASILAAVAMLQELARADTDNLSAGFSYMKNMLGADDEACKGAMMQLGMIKMKEEAQGGQQDMDVDDEEDDWEELPF